MVANWGAAPAVYLNDGSGSFERVRPGDLGGRIEYVGAIASGDYDSDGKVDVYIGSWPNDPGEGELNSLYWNGGGGGHGLRVRLIGTSSNRDGIGARVLLTARQGGETVTQMREVTTQMGFRGQRDISPHFGLGSASEVLSLEVRWPSGGISLLENVAPDQIVEVAEPAAD
jgi:hypothetical protein